MTGLRRSAGFWLFANRRWLDPSDWADREQLLQVAVVGSYELQVGTGEAFSLKSLCRLRSTPQRIPEFDQVPKVQLSRRDLCSPCNDSDATLLFDAIDPNLYIG